MSTYPNSQISLGAPGQGIMFRFYSHKPFNWIQRLSLYLMGWKYLYNENGIFDPWEIK